MDLIEQAVFTSAMTDRGAGYQLAASSEGLCDEDARALTCWGPSHDALIASGPSALSVNFHPLPTGNYCVSRTTAAGAEYSGRGGARVYTQCLVLDGETFRRFGNNPFSVIRTASGSGLLRQYATLPARLEPIPLVGRAQPVDSVLLSKVQREIGAETIAALVQAALTCGSMAIVGEQAGELVVAALLNCLPPDCRTEFSFSTGLRFSARRPFRLVALGTDTAEHRRVRRVYEMSVVDLSENLVNQYPPDDQWPRAILRVLRTGRTSLLNRHFLEDRLDPKVDDLRTPNTTEQDSHGRGNTRSREPVLLAALEVLALEVLEELEGLPSGEEPRRDATRGESVDGLDAGDSRQDSRGRETAGSQVAHAPHPRFQRQSAESRQEESPIGKASAAIDADDPRVVKRLEELDDLVYEAINGDGRALQTLQSRWPDLRGELGEELLGESREQFLRYALTIWEKCVGLDGVRHTDKAAAALEVLCLIFNDS